MKTILFCVGLVAAFGTFLPGANGHRYYVAGPAGSAVSDKDMHDVKHRVTVLEDYVRVITHNMNETHDRIQVIENVLNPGFLQVVYDILALNKLTLSIKDLDSKPAKATLYEDVDYQGKELEFNPQGVLGPACLNFGELAGKISSVKTYDSCVRLYRDPDCEGENEFVTPFTNNTANLGDNDNKYKSITGCTPPKSR